MVWRLPFKLKGTLRVVYSRRDPVALRPVLFKVFPLPLLLAMALLPYCKRCVYLVRQSYMFCLMCSPFPAGTAFFIACGPIFVFPCGYLYRLWFMFIYIRFIRIYVYNLARTLSLTSKTRKTMAYLKAHIYFLYFSVEITTNVHFPG